MLVPKCTVSEVLGRRLFRVSADNLISTGKTMVMHAPANHADWCLVGGADGRMHFGGMMCMPITCLI